jgi:hypothetical protein
MAKQGEWVITWPHNKRDRYVFLRINNSSTEFWVDSFKLATGFSSEEEAQRICNEWVHSKPVPALFNILNIEPHLL